MSFDADFSYAFYETLIRKVQQRYEICPLRDVNSHVVDAPDGVPRAYWRHDIDVCLSSALQIAKLEANLGISSTFMFIPNSLLYDISSKEGRDILCKISALGHEVALHFDISETGLSEADCEDEAQLIDEIVRQAKFIGEIIDEDPKSVSFHRPLQRFIRGPSSLGGLTNAYAAELMGFYISDSKGAWRDGNPLEVVGSATANVVQILTHPVWWGPKHLNAKETLKKFWETSSVGLSKAGSDDLADRIRETIPGVALEQV